MQRLVKIAMIVAALLFAGIAVPDVSLVAGNHAVGHDVVKAAPGHTDDGSNSTASAQPPQDQGCPEDGACCCPVSVSSSFMPEVNFATAFVPPIALRLLHEALSLPVPSGHEPPLHPPRAA
ncbi:MAG: hypothetical protein EXR08_08635 [Alphaproteobacteria bacterium]|nr:hypothetical protein [Alphaproteobacteria bacterium]